jgi:hypothetical protein
VNPDAAAGAIRHHVAHDVFGEDDRRQHVEAHQRLDLAVVHRREQAFCAKAGIVDEAVDRAEFVAQAFDEGGNGIDVAEIEGAKRNAAAAFRRSHDCFAQIVAFATRDRDDLIASTRKPLRDRKPDTAATACQEDITHLIARAFRPR